ncbi:MAG: transglutaminase family protein [Selenomonadaceae bacterium]|nr:transglutaminase family protein [Selenomonadaceae bacterium]
MKKLEFEFSSCLTFSASVTDHAFLLRCLPRPAKGQELVSHTVRISFGKLPMESLAEGRDSFGNTTIAGWMAEEHDSLSYAATGVVLRDDQKKEREECSPCYCYDSSMTKPSAEMEEFACQLGLAGEPLEDAERIAEAVHAWFSYAPGTTDVNTTAAEAFHRKSGVCQDYAHVFIALARMAGIPARYVCGLPKGEGATHAWAEVWQDGIWYGYDPTRACHADERYIVLAVGRDYGDCPTERGVFKGKAFQMQQSFMQVMEG